MKILLTGAAGFLARACLVELASRGHEVLTTDCRGRVDHVGDLADTAFCATLPDADAVVHAAAVQYVSRDMPWIRRQAYFQHNNVEATRQLCARYSGLSTRFVNVGTSMMYAQDGSPVYSTGSPMQGQGVYSRSKLAAQAWVDALPNSKATIIPCIIGGVGREGLFRSFVNMMQSLGVVAFPGSGRHKTSMVHVKDVASLIACVIESGASGLFNAAAPDPLSIEQWIDEISAELALGAVRRIHLPLAPVRALSALSGYRILAREQLLMLAQPHVLGIEESLATGWQPRFDNARIVRDIARYIADSAKDARSH
ncbi:MAG: NAD(P)-dependent oxidoreductase [Burkholderiales bacterium]|nr:NAD(P)-dependent oxidoreductase [Burkholderiales bacterium]